MFAGVRNGLIRAIPRCQYPTDPGTVAEIWEISENLHRAELTKLERDEQIARWIELVEQKRIISQSEKKPDAGRPEGGVKAV